jgi:SecD/SecF fusion protein
MNWLTQSILFVPLLLIGLVVVSWLLGLWLGKAVRMPDYGWKFSLILFALLASISAIWRNWPPHFGIDLGGGAVLVYRVDQSKTVWHPDKMESLIKSIIDSVNPGGQKEITVRSLGQDMVEITMPAVVGATAEQKQAELEQVKRRISTQGALEFRIVATRRFDQSTIEAAAAERKAAWEQHPGTDNGRVYPDPRTGKKEIGEWCPVRIKDGKEVESFKNNPAIAPATIELSDGKDKDGKEHFHSEVLLLAPESESRNVTGRFIRDARVQPSPEGGYEVSFFFDSEGGQRFGKLTGEHTPLDGDTFYYNLAIVLDHVLQSAPRLKSQIFDNGSITGDYELKEAQDLADIINRGALPAALYQTPEREMVTEATLGADTIRQSLTAMIIAAIMVPWFMLYYYRFAGVVAVLVLSLTVLMLVAIMVLVKAPFTLTALAGLALAVGMEVDNNVLIYERLREELRHGAALRMALRNSFHRVGVVIIDANITHVLAAAVLFYVGTEQVKGFAITFLLGALLSIWATMFVAKTLFEVCERRRWVQKINMRQWIGHTTIDFMHWFPACATFSVLITVVGLGVAIVRGSGLFDIDFTGGISVQAVFRPDEKIDAPQIREAIAKYDKDHPKDLPDATVTQVQIGGENRYVIDTSNSNGDFVKKLIQQLFGEKLVTSNLKYTEPVVAPTTSPGEKTPTEKTSEKQPEGLSTSPAGPSLHAPEPKPTGEPVDMSVPKPQAKATGAAPTRGPPAPTGAAPTRPAPTGTKATEPKGKQSQTDLPPASFVAMAGREAFLLAQADTGKAKPEPKSAEVKPAAKSDTSASAKTDAKSEVKPEPKADAKTAPKADTKSDAKPAANSGSKSAEKHEAQPAPAEDESEPTTPPVAPPLQANLSFTVASPVGGEKTQGARYEKEQVGSLIEKAMEAKKFTKGKDYALDLSNDNGATSTVSDQWKVTISPIAGAKVAVTPALVKEVLAAVQSEVAKQPYFPGVDNMGSAVANDAKFWACVALVLSWALIIIYLWIRFQGVAFGLAAVIALIHDVLVMLGAIAFSSYLALIPGVTAVTLIEPFKINLTIVAAFLTIIGYSVNDTIVVFDRIREIRGKSPVLTRQMVNDATNQTLSRTVLTSFTVLLVVLILYIFGGQAMHGFAFALFIGVLTGTYSSIYVAAPILLWLLHPKEMQKATASSEAVTPTR